MKKLFIFLALLPTFAIAENIQQVYNSLARPSAQQIAMQETSGKNAINSAKANYQKAEAALEADYESCQLEVARVQQAMADIAAKQSKPTQQQMQVASAVSGDMMSALAAAGISMEQAAKMSDEQLMVILAPMVSQKTGMTEAEMQMLQGMSDREAEAYLKSHPEMASRIQNSQYGQYGQAMQGSASVAHKLNDADVAKSERITAISDQLQAMDEKGGDVINFVTGQSQIRKLGSYREELEAQFESKGYEKRISDIYSELYARYEADGLYGGKGGPANAPDYTKSYIDRINKVIDEYNVYATNLWVKEIQKYIDVIDSELKAHFPLYLERVKLYNGIGDDYVKGMCAHQLIGLSERTRMNLLLELLEERINAPLQYRRAVPQYVDAAQ